MSTNLSRVFVARLLGLDVFDPLGDRLGRLRDVVVLSRGTRGAPHVVGIVVEVPGKKRVFVPMTRITSIDQTQIICTGLVNLRRFEQRGAETLVVAECSTAASPSPTAAAMPHRGHRDGQAPLRRLVRQQALRSAAATPSPR